MPPELPLIYYWCDVNRKLHTFIRKRVCLLSCHLCLIQWLYLRKMGRWSFLFFQVYDAIIGRFLPSGPQFSSDICCDQILRNDVMSNSLYKEHFQIGMKNKSAFIIVLCWISFYLAILHNFVRPNHDITNYKHMLTFIFIYYKTLKCLAFSN